MDECQICEVRYLETLKATNSISLGLITAHKEINLREILSEIGSNKKCSLLEQET